MARNRRRARTAVIAAYLLAGAIIVQLGPMCTILGSTAFTAFNFGSLLDENEMFLGLFRPCGVPNTQEVYEDGTIVSSVANWQDDLIQDCPVTAIIVQPDAGG